MGRITRMRRTLITLLAAPALLLAGCSGEEPAVVEATSPVTAPDGAATTTGPSDEAAATDAPADGDSATSAPGDEAAGTAGPDEVEGGAEGQAAADRAKEFLLALVTADADACGMLLSFSDPDQPMTAIESDLELCETQLPATMKATVEAQGLGEEGVGILEAMQITGADVQDDIAVVDKDNYSPLFADAMGDSTITLKKIDGEWYVDIDAYLETP